MSGETFSLDTNILVYALDSTAGARHLLAARIMDRAVELDCRLTLQAVSEFYAAVTRKRLMTPADAAAQVGDWVTLFPTMAATASAVRAALAHAVAGRASYWDALLVETAAEGGCGLILSEDMTSGTTLGAAKVLNPFGVGALSPEASRLLTLD